MIYMIQQLMTYCNREECFGIICIIYISQLRKVDCTVLVINLCKKFTNTLDNPSLKTQMGTELSTSSDVLTMDGGKLQIPMVQCYSIRTGKRHILQIPEWRRLYGL